MNRFRFKSGVITERTAMALNDIAAWIEREERTRKGDSEFPTVERRRVKLTAHNGGTPPIYTGVEQSFTIAGVEEDKPNGEQFSPTNQPIYERNGQTVSAAALTAGYHCWVDRRTLVNGVPTYEFDIGEGSTAKTGAVVYLDSNQSISNAAYNTLTGFSETNVFNTFAGFVFDDGYFDSGSSDSFTIPTDGRYMVGARIHWDAGMVGQRIALITHPNLGVDISSDTILPTSASYSTVQSVFAIGTFTATEVIKIRVWHDQGSALNVLGRNGTNNPRTVFWIYQL